MERTPLVSIRCTVYNHEPYLRQCLDGFVMQQTNFPFEAIVHDDASTDGSVAIIREYAEKYPDIIKPIYETENQYSKNDGSWRRVLDSAIHPAAKYVALCEGDDYWTDPLKLQKQVDIMELDESIGLVHSAVDIYVQTSESFYEFARGLPLISFEDELMSNKCYTLTTCFRKKLYFDYHAFINSHEHNQWKMGDYPMWLYMSYFSKASYLPESTGVYRVLEHSASHSSSAQKQVDFELSAYDVRVFFAKTFDRSDLLKKITTNLVYTLQRISLINNSSIRYDIWGLYKKYGFSDASKLFAKHIVLQNKVLRNLYVRFIERTGKNYNNIQLAIDDFGTGYSSLSYLHKFPAHLLKVDKSFIDKINSSKSSRDYVEAIISIGHIMGFAVIAEGVEQDDQLKALRETGCDFVQGYIWGRPLPPEDAEKLMHPA